MKASALVDDNDVVAVVVIPIPTAPALVPATALALLSATTTCVDLFSAVRSLIDFFICVGVSNIWSVDVDALPAADRADTNVAAEDVGRGDAIFTFIL